MRRCKHCKSKFVCWNWVKVGGFNSWKMNFKIGVRSATRTPWTFFTQRWLHECWDCDSTFTTMFEVKNGIPYEKLKTDYKYLGSHMIKDIDKHLWYTVNETKNLENHEHDKNVHERRKKMAIDLVIELFDKQWEIDHGNKEEIEFK